MMRKRLKKLFGLMISILIILSIIPIESYAVSDISNHWAKNVIESWVERGLAKGYPDGTFKPNNLISRAEFISLVNNAFGFTEEAEISFNDVHEAEWYVVPIKRAVAAGYISGYPDGTIKPEAPITRQEVAVIIAKIMKLNLNEEAAEIFKDKDKLNWSKGYVGAVVAAKYMVGYPDGNFNPLNNITRGEAIYALNNVIEGTQDVAEVQAVAKQDFLGITYIRVKWNQGIKPTVVKANGQELIYDSSDGEWKGTALDLHIGDDVEIVSVINGIEKKMVIKVKDILDN